MAEQTIEPLDRIAFQIGPISVYWYGILIGIGVVTGYLLATREASRRGLGKDTIGDLLIWLILFGIIGARLYYVIFRWEEFHSNPLRVFAIWNGGLAIHGALIAGIITIYVFCQKRGLSIWKLLDIIAPSVLIGQAIGRWGNFMNQEVYGGPMTEGQVELYYQLLPDFIMRQMYIDDPVYGLNYYHPTFLYESLWNFLGVLVLLYLRRVNLRQGEIFFSYLIWYSAGRFVIEGIRLDNLMIGDVIRVAQLVSLALIIAAVFLWWYRRAKGLARARYLDEENKSGTKKKKRRSGEGRK